MKHLVMLSLLSVAGWAQTGRNVVLNWTDTANPAGTTYKVKRAPGQCTGTPAYAVLASGLTAKTYTDTTATIGLWCYVTTATFGGLESADSNTAPAGLLPVPPVMGTVTFARLVVVPPSPEIVAAVMGY